MSFMKKSPWLIHYDGSSCNGCDIEVLACLTPLYDVERFGIVNTGNPKHADIFLVTGGVNAQNLPVVCQIYEQMPEPKVVVAVGACACTGGVFHDCYNMIGGMDKAIPVDVYVPGCAARPEAIIGGVVRSLEILEEKRQALKVRAAREEEEEEGCLIPAAERLSEEGSGSFLKTVAEETGKAVARANRILESGKMNRKTGIPFDEGGTACSR